MHPTFDILGEMLSRKNSSGIVFTPGEVRPAGGAHPLAAEGILKFTDAVPQRWTLDEGELASFVSRKLGLGGEVRRFAGVWHLGRVADEAVFYASNAPENFFATHKSACALVLGANDAAIPHWWQGTCALLSELFWIAPDGAVKTDLAAAARLVPKTPEKRVRHVRKAHERRRDWLRFFVDWFAAPLDPRTVKKGLPSMKYVARWFRENTVRPPRNIATYYRDIEAFCHYDPEKDACDKREKVIETLWHAAAREDLPHGRAVAVRISDILVKLRDEDDNPIAANPLVPTARAAWENGRIVAAM